MSGLTKQASALAEVSSLREGVVKRGIREIVCTSCRRSSLPVCCRSATNCRASASWHRRSTSAARRCAAPSRVWPGAASSKSPMGAARGSPATMSGRSPSASAWPRRSTATTSNRCMQRVRWSSAMWWPRRPCGSTMIRWPISTNTSRRRRPPKTIPVRFLISDREFHVAIYRAAENPLLADFTMDLYAYMLEHRRRAVSDRVRSSRAFVNTSHRRRLARARLIGRGRGLRRAFEADLSDDASSSSTRILVLPFCQPAKWCPSARMSADRFVNFKIRHWEEI